MCTVVPGHRGLPILDNPAGQDPLLTQTVAGRLGSSLGTAGR